MTDARAGEVECGKHGTASATYVCRHLIASLRSGKRVGFVSALDSNVPRPDAWCHSCEAERVRCGGEWTDESESFAGVTLLCSGCYDEVRALNS